jgi:hypothetical protein
LSVAIARARAAVDSTGAGEISATGYTSTCVAAFKFIASHSERDGGELLAWLAVRNSIQITIVRSFLGPIGLS